MHFHRNSVRALAPPAPAERFALWLRAAEVPIAGGHGVAQRAHRRLAAAQPLAVLGEILR